jgi:hypothetical protein
MFEGLIRCWEGERVISSVYFVLLAEVLEGEVAIIDSVGNSTHCIRFTLRSELGPPFEVYIPCAPRRW